MSSIVELNLRSFPDFSRTLSTQRVFVTYNEFKVNASTIFLPASALFNPEIVSQQRISIPSANMSEDKPGGQPGVPPEKGSEHRRTRGLVAGTVPRVQETQNVTQYKKASGLVMKSGVIYFGVRLADMSGKYNISVTWNVTVGSYGVSTEFISTP